jgi:hypothetical protein
MVQRYFVHDEAGQIQQIDQQDRWRGCGSGVLRNSPGAQRFTTMDAGPSAGGARTIS